MVCGVRACLGVYNCVGFIAAPTVTFTWISKFFKGLVTANISDSNELFSVISFSVSSELENFRGRNYDVWVLQTKTPKNI